MNNKYKTLRELNVQPGDVVENSNSGLFDIVFVTNETKHPRAKLVNPGQLVALSVDGCNHQEVNTSCCSNWRIVSRAPREETPKLWRDMTPEEKGALLLAHHEGKEIESNDRIGGEWIKVERPSWFDHLYYRVRQEPKRETMTLYYKIPNSGIIKKIGTIDLIDGKPDKDSIKMDEL